MAFLALFLVIVLSLKMQIQYGVIVDLLYGYRRRPARLLPHRPVCLLCACPHCAPVSSLTSYTAEKPPGWRTDLPSCHLYGGAPWLYLSARGLWSDCDGAKSLVGEHHIVLFHIYVFS